MSVAVEKIEKLAGAFAKLAAFTDNGVETKVVPIEQEMSALAQKLVAAGEDTTSVSPMASKWNQLKKSFSDIIGNYGKTIAMIIATNPSDPRVAYWKILKARLAKQVAAREGGESGYRSGAEVIRKNRVIVDIINRAIGTAGQDRGVISQISNRLGNAKKGSVAIILKLAPKQATAVEVTGVTDPTMRNYIIGAIRPSAGWIDAAMKKSKVEPTEAFTYEFARLPY